MKSNKTNIINSIIFIALIFITYYIIFRTQNMYILYKQLKSLNLVYIFLGLLTMLIYFMVEAINVKIILTSFGEKTTLRNTLKYTLIGFFFSSITPAATGGQPMEVYYMSKDNIKISHGAMALLIHVCGYQMSTVFLGLISALFAPHIIGQNLLYLFIIGTIFNMVPVTITLIGIFSPKTSAKIIKVILNLLRKLKIKNIDEIEIKINNELLIFNESSNYVKTHQHEFIKALFRAFIQILVFYSVPCIIYKSFNLTGFNILDSIKFQALLHSTVCSMPLPGSVGVTETVFILIYSYAYPINLIQSAVLTNRFVTFYFFVIVGLINFLIAKIKADNKKNNQ